MAINTKKLKHFLEAMINRTDSANIKLYQLTVSGRLNTVWFSEKRWVPEETIPVIVESAKSMTEGQGRTKFLLKAFDPDADDACIGALGFSMDSDKANDYGENAMLDPPTAAGLISQLMRHNLDLHRIIMQYEKNSKKEEIK